MSYDLTLSNYDENGRRLTRAEREAARAAAQEAERRKRKIRVDVQEQGWKINGIIQLARHGMNEMVTLNNDRRQIAGNDPEAHMVCVDIEEEALRQIKGAQRDLGRKWEL